MITSNAPDPEYFRDNILLPYDKIERVRLQDRIAASLLLVMVDGVSYRSQNAAGQQPWWKQ